MLVFRKIWCAFFSCSTRFEIRPFALLLTICTFKVATDPSTSFSQMSPSLSAFSFNSSSK